MSFFVLKNEKGLPTPVPCEAETAIEAIEKVCGVDRTGFLAVIEKDFGDLFIVEGFEVEGDFVHE